MMMKTTIYVYHQPCDNHVTTMLYMKVLYIYEVREGIEIVKLTRC